jgi:hypothetical protein
MGRRRKRARESSPSSMADSQTSSPTLAPEQELREPSQELANDRGSRFDRRHATATTSAEDVLGEVFRGDPVWSRSINASKTKENMVIYRV